MTDVWTGRSRPVLRGEDSLVSGTFSSDGRFLAVADENGRLTLWDGRARRALAVLAEDGPRGAEPQRVVAFSADSVCARARGGVTRQEWRTYLADFPYRRTC